MQVGFKALATRYGIDPVQPLRVDSTIGTVRASRDTGSQVENKYPPNYRPDDDFAGHFEFGLKYEEIPARPSSVPAMMRHWRCSLAPSCGAMRHPIALAGS
ncbi:hypothetical protein JET64_05930 [Pseudomonas putida]|nr:hypothetical protein [Pseudomonas putida]